ncbi:hypothetical protein [Desulforegula conservatrix]|uniref:hypothetical protein n=1 Tax=Desulforegula conservatrix TaxID=153026 RepID=UPI0004217078|nr:hypothetical protein [Desulforegula conservatrix]
MAKGKLTRISHADLLKQSLLSVMDDDAEYFDKNEPSPIPDTSDRVTDQPTELPIYQLTDRVINIPSTIPNNRADMDSVNRANDRITDRAAEIPNNRAEYRTAEIPNDRANNQITDIPNNRIVLPEIDWRRKPSDLNNHQYQLLHAIYFHRPFKVDAERNDGIGDLIVPPVSVDNVRSRIKSLLKKGYILDRFSVNCSPQKMTTCIVNTDKCLPLFGETHIRNDDQLKLRSNSPDPMFYSRVAEIPDNRVHNRITESYFNRPDNRPTESPNNRQDTLISSSSSSYFKNTTTTANDSVTDWIREQLLHPELEFWNSNNISVEQVTRAISSVVVEPEVLIQSMKYYAFEASKPDAKQPDTNHWFYFLGGVKKNGLWLRPSGYESHEERAIRIKDEIIKSRQDELTKLRERNLKAAQLERDLEFENFFARFSENPTDPRYDDLYNAAINDFERGRMKSKNHNTVKTVWLRLLGELPINRVTE